MTHSHVIDIKNVQNNLSSLYNEAQDNMALKLKM